MTARADVRRYPGFLAVPDRYASWLPFGVRAAVRAIETAPDLRDYGIGAQILVDLGLRKLRLMTNNPKKIAGLEGYGLEIVEHVPLISSPTPHNIRYLHTKAEKLGHLLEPEEEKG